MSLGDGNKVTSGINSAASSAKAVVVVNFIFNIVMSASLQSLFNMINAQQLIVLMPLFDINMPANAQLFFNQIMKIAAFDIIDTEAMLNKLLHLKKTKPLNENFNKLGFESLWFLNNMGSLMIGFFLYAIAIIVLKILEQFTERSEKIKSFYEKLRSALFYNTLVAIFTESYSLMCVCCMINFTNISFKSFGEGFQTSVNFVFFALLFVYPVVITVHCYRNWSRIDEIKKHFESYFEEMRI